jgi:putative ABC transport system permease protein
LITFAQKRSFAPLERMARTIRQASRNLGHAPGFVAVAVLTLALGIGLATAVFTVADGMALRRLPMRDQSRLVVMWSQSKDGRFSQYPVGDAAEFVRQSRAVQDAAYFAWFGSAPIAVREAGQVTRLRRAVVSGGFFRVLGTHAFIGRPLEAGDDQPGAAPAAVISYDAWRHTFGAARDVLGRRLPLYDGSRTYTVVGVMPPGFEYPPGTDFWTSLAASFPEEVRARIGFDVVGRLAPGATPADAAGELSAFLSRPQASVYDRNLRGVVHTLPDLVLGNMKPALAAFGVAAALLLLITCVNVANLLLVRGLGRAREIAIRLALGAGRRTVIGQLVIENLMLALAGGVAGLAVAWGALHLFVALAPAGTPRLDEIGLDGSALLAAVGVTTAALLVFGVLPAVVSARVDLQDVLRSGTRQTSSRAHRRFAELLVGAEVALAFVVLSAAALIGRSLLNLERAPLGFEADHLLVANLAFRADLLSDMAKSNAELEALMPKLAAVPGIVAVSPVVTTPFSGPAAWSGRPATEGQSASEAAGNPIVNMELVDTGYFAAMGMPILRGRAFTADDRTGAPGVVIVGDSAARLYWPNENPIGKRLWMDSERDDTYTVIGVVPDARYRALRDAMPSMYFPIRQSIFAAGPASLVVRTAGPPGAVVPMLRRAIAQSAPGVGLADAAPFATFLDGPLGEPRLDAFLLSVFAIAAVLLCAIGVFGVMAATVRQRTREIGIRTALGAQRGALVRLFVASGLGTAVIGAVIGVAVAVGAGNYVASLLYQVSPRDPVSLAEAAVVLVLVAAVASYLPARRAARVDPMTVLRDD